MTKQKSLKGRVRARMEKTGERYTSARRHVLAKASAETEVAQAPEELPSVSGQNAALAPTALSTSDAAMVRATGRSHDDWFALLDAWGATAHTHTEIAEWLATTRGAPSWWRQAITVDYERARGMRGRHEMADGFSISVTRTIDANAERALEAFTNESTRASWLVGAPIQPRPTRARLTARFDWSEPTSRVVVTIVPRGAGKSTIAITHERLADAAAAALQKVAWRERLGALKSLLEAD